MNSACGVAGDSLHGIIMYSWNIYIDPFMTWESCCHQPCLWGVSKSTLTVQTPPCVHTHIRKVEVFSEIFIGFVPWAWHQVVFWATSRRYPRFSGQQKRRLHQRLIDLGGHRSLFCWNWADLACPIILEWSSTYVHVRIIENVFSRASVYQLVCHETGEYYISACKLRICCYIECCIA